VAILFALALPVLLGFAALVIDLGHGWQVRNQVQNSVDAAALAGALDLDGTPGQFSVARASAQYYAQQNLANGSALSLGANSGNRAGGNIVLGNWDFTTRSFTPGDAAMPPYQINAVQVNAPTVTFPTWFARIFGANSEDVRASAVAVGGSPGATCGFPLAVPDCAVLGANGQVLCDQHLVFGQDESNGPVNTGFTVFTSISPDQTSMDCNVARALGYPCPGGCTCTQTCNPTAVNNGPIYITDDNYMSQQVVDWVNQSISSTGDQQYVQVPVLQSGQSPASCDQFRFDRQQRVSGYVALRLDRADPGPPATIRATVVCTRTTNSSSPNGTGGFFGYRSTAVYLVK
jgi:hypothetical protein